MPEPIENGKVAKNIERALTDWDREDVEDFVEISFLAARGDIDGIQEVAARGTRRNLDAVEVGIYKQANMLKRADDIIMNAIAALRKRLAG